MLCSAEERKHTALETWEWVNDERVYFFFVCPFKLCNLRLFKLLNSCCSVSVSSNRLWCSCFCTSLSNLGESGARGWKEWNEVFKNPSTSLFLPDSFQERVENLTRTSDKRHKHLTWKPVHRNHQLKKMACTSCYGWSQNFFLKTIVYTAVHPILNKRHFWGHSSYRHENENSSTCLIHLWSLQLIHFYKEIYFLYFIVYKTKVKQAKN